MIFTVPFPYDKNFVIRLLKYSKNSYESYFPPEYLFSFGNEEGLYAKVFSEENYTIVSFRGTMLDLPIFSRSKLTKNNKILDNIIYGCCKDTRCLQEKVSIFKSHSYISDSRLFVNQIKKLFPRKKIILIGHSMGGSIASIVGRIENLEVLAFSSPGEKYVSDLISKNKDSKIFHLGMCNDPIFTGKCTSNISVCNLFGYTVQTKCHNGNVFCIDFYSFQSILFHKLSVLEHFVSRDWPHIQYKLDKCSDCLSK